MKNPDEIKKGLECCAAVYGKEKCELCPYRAVVACQQELKLDYLALIQQLEAQVPRWISVEERLPEANVLVLCVWLDGRDKTQNRGFATYQRHGVWYVSNEGMPVVTHWMPLPEPPKEECK